MPYLDHEYNRRNDENELRGFDEGLAFARVATAMNAA